MKIIRTFLVALAAIGLLMTGLTAPAQAASWTRTWPGVKATVNIPNPCCSTISTSTSTTITTPDVTKRVVEVYLFGQHYKVGPDGPVYRLDFKRFSHTSWGLVTYRYKTVSDYPAVQQNSGIFSGHKYWGFIRIKVYRDGKLVTLTNTYFYGDPTKLNYDAVPDGE